MKDSFAIKQISTVTTTLENGRLSTDGAMILSASGELKAEADTNVILRAEDDMSLVFSGSQFEITNGVTGVTISTSEVEIYGSDSVTPTPVNVRGGNAGVVTNRSAGGLTLSTGQSRGFGSGSMEFLVADSGKSSGTSTNTPEAYVHLNGGTRQVEVNRTLHLSASEGPEIQMASGSIKFATKTMKKVVPPWGGFLYPAASVELSHNIPLGLMGIDTAGGAVIPINLPSGSILTGLSSKIWTTTSAPFEYTLYRKSYSANVTGSADVVAHTEATGSGPSAENTISLSTSEIIKPDEYGYYLHVYLRANPSTAISLGMTELTFTMDEFAKFNS